MNGSLLTPVAHDVPVAHGDAVAGHPDHALDEGLPGLLGRRRGHGWSSACAAPQRGGRSSAPAGGWKVMMSPTLGSAPRRWLRRLTSTRWPTSSVGSIEPLGIR